MRYADDFVMCVAVTRRHADAVVTEPAQVLRPLGLTLSTEKTRITHIDEGIDFLGWRIKRDRARRGRAGIFLFPSKPSLRSVLGKIKEITRSGTNQSLDQLLHRLNPVLRGWCAYFRSGQSSRTFQYLRGRVSSWDEVALGPLVRGAAPYRRAPSPSWASLPLRRSPTGDRRRARRRCCSTRAPSSASPGPARSYRSLITSTGRATILLDVANELRRNAAGRFPQLKTLDLLRRPPGEPLSLPPDLLADAEALRRLHSPARAREAANRGEIATRSWPADYTSPWS